MNISVKQLLAKIENELLEAKACTNSSQIREKVYAIKSLSELILEAQMSSAPVETYTTTPNVQPVSRTLGANESNRLQMDEANGDSIFDF